ncbi:MAG: TetR family transcriptional regulator [Crocinitomicaceae bacterium]|nr:TetR family transcriptional regulator [Crocinitomicaceae bacterium]|tara:strand:- start:70942 stop:71604 length:663 start_codon:yes stop_codon:yes gene_type:complete
MIVQVKIQERCFIKDPDTSELGQNIVANSISLIDEIGFEAFTFKKLAKRIESTEASVYRYFENKHKLLIYLVSWYWNWFDYRLTFAMQNIASPERRLEIFIEHITHPVKVDPTFSHIDEVALHRIVISESSKAYLTKDVDSDDQEGYFISFKNLVNELSKMIAEVNPNYKYPNALISTIIESAHFQRFFSKHLRSLTESNSDLSLELFLKHLLFSSIKPD